MSRKKLYFIGFLFTLLSGTALHFTYELFGQNPIVGIFSSTDESVPQHLKLLFWPYVFFSVFEYIKYARKEKNFIFVKTLSVLFGMAVIVIFFYAYTAILGKDVLFLDIFAFILGDFSAFLLSYKLLN